MAKPKNVDDESWKPLVSNDEEDQQPLKKPTATVRRSSSGRSCLSCCCTCMLITVALLLALLTLVAVVAYGWISTAVHDFTVSEPLPLIPVVDMSDEELRVFEDRMSRFAEELHDREKAAAAGAAVGDPVDDLVISQDEINGLIGRCDGLRGNVHVALEEGLIYEWFSVPTDGLPGGTGRYFVGRDYLKTYGGEHVEVSMETAATHEGWFDGPLLFAQLQYMVNEKDMLELYLEKGSVFGNEAPDDFISQRINLLEEDRGLSKIEYVSIHPGKIVVHPRKEVVGLLTEWRKKVAEEEKEASGNPEPPQQQLHE